MDFKLSSKSSKLLLDASFRLGMIFCPIHFEIPSPVSNWFILFKKCYFDVRLIGTHDTSVHIIQIFDSEHVVDSSMVENHPITI